MTTAVFAFAENCGHCKMFKQKQLPLMRTIFEQSGIDVIVRTAKDYNVGFGLDYDDPSILTQVEAFPTALLVNTKLMNSGSPLQVIMQGVYVFNGDVNINSGGKMIRPTRGPYSTTPGDIKKYVDDYFSKYGTNTVDTPAINNKQEQRPAARNTYKHRQGYILLDNKSNGGINRDKRF